MEKKTEATKAVTTIRLVPLGHSLSLTLAFSYIACVLFDLLLPTMAMHTAWQALLPGFQWLSFSSFLLGLAESYAYGWYFAVLIGGLYNIFAKRGERPNA